LGGPQNGPSIRKFAAGAAILAIDRNGRKKIFLAANGGWPIWFKRPRASFGILCGTVADFAAFHEVLRHFRMGRNPGSRWNTFIRGNSAVLLLVLAGLALAAGSVDQAAERTRLQLTQMPENAQHVLAVHKQLAAAKKDPNAAKSAEVVVTGQIGGMPNVWTDTHPDFPWYAGQSSFFLVDQKIASQFAVHAKKHGGNHSCAFCKSLAAKNAHAAAVVNLVDEQGEILRIDSRELLGLKENQTVVVRGTAKLLGGRMLVIDATGIHVAQ
jgi:hypothetical protein